MDLTVYIENIVKGFSRYYKYTLGADLRNLSRETVRLIIKANSEIDKYETLCKVRDTVEEIKVVARICREVKAFGNFRSFEHIMNETISLSRQGEGWLKSVKGKK
jgi:hypothetical protein